MAPYQIITDATADLSAGIIKEVPNIKIIPMEVEIGGKNYSYGPKGDISIEEFYRLQRKGNYATTSQINPTTYFEFFESHLKNGTDILYLCFSSGLSGMLQSAGLCVEMLRYEYPERKIICMDTLCASIGEGLLVFEAMRKQEEGLSLEELTKWIMDNCLKSCHWFTVDTFEHLKYGGRVSSAAAAIGSALSIKPLLSVDEKGLLQVKEKPRGRRKAIQIMVGKMEEGWQPEISKTVIVGHGNNPEAAELLRQAVATRFEEAEIYIADIGPVIGAHTGPDMLALVYWGNNR
ncbi:MAG: DegV family protein [Christensenellales bacterium]|jgi:DegV family protein with EDD domain|nr:DegV family protein [Christensenellaceae bacterium]